MSTLTDRLRGVIKPPAGGGGPEGPPLRHDDEIRDDHEIDRRGASSGAPGAAEVLGGDLRDGYLVVDRKYTPGHRHGRVTVADALPPADAPWEGLGLLLNGTVPSGRLVFIDLETTGLAGGAGTCAFLVGCGWFDGGTFRVRQFFLSTYGGERALLDAIRDVAGDAGTIVSYNGKTFDLPLIETRFLFHRMETPFAGLPHIDMLHPARRLWRPDEDETGGGGCRLTTIEATQLGYVREDDVPGFEIPARYFHYVRTGDARPLSGVLEHNRLDILSLAMITAHAAQLIEDGPAAARTAREALGLGRLYERVGRVTEARQAFSCAVEMTPVDPMTCAEALRSWAVLARRARQYEEAATAWRRLLDSRRCPPRLAREATEALAIHHEHRLRDLDAARRFALDSLQFNGSRSRTAAVQHRLARIDRKLGAAPIASAPLF